MIFERRRIVRVTEPIVARKKNPNALMPYPKDASPKEKARIRKHNERFRKNISQAMKDSKKASEARLKHSGVPPSVPKTQPKASRLPHSSATDPP